MNFFTKFPATSLKKVEITAVHAPLNNSLNHSGHDNLSLVRHARTPEYPVEIRIVEEKEVLKKGTVTP